MIVFESWLRSPLFFWNLFGILLKHIFLKILTFFIVKYIAIFKNFNGVFHSNIKWNDSIQQNDDEGGVGHASCVIIVGCEWIVVLTCVYFKGNFSDSHQSAASASQL